MYVLSDNPGGGVQDRSIRQSAKIGTRAFTGTAVTVPIRFLSAIGSLFVVLLVLIAALFLTKYINDNYEAFQTHLKGDVNLQKSMVALVNTLLSFINLFQTVILYSLEIWNYTVPILNLAGYLFFRVIVAIFLTIAGQGNQQNDAGDTALPLGTPDPTSTLSGGVETFLNMLTCIVIDMSTFFAGLFKVWMRALGAILVVIFQWLDQNLQRQWYRKEYCRRGTGSSGSYGDDWQTTQNPNNPSQPIYQNGSGPGNVCPDNTHMIQGLIRLFEMIINIWRDAFIMVFPLIADLLKMFFDSLLKILPQLMEGLIKIIELFAPDQPLGKFLMFCLNFLIQALGYLVRSCVLQLIISTVMCFFNVAAALIVNTIRGICKAVVKVVCLGGSVCHIKVPGSYLRFPTCTWTLLTSCVEQNYDSKIRQVTQFCQIPTCSNTLKTSYQPMHRRMSAQRTNFADTEDYQLQYYQSCLATHANGTTKKEETVEGHLFCRYLTEDVHKPIPLGMDPSKAQNPFDNSENLCEDIQQTCLCKYNSPICESQTCCLTYYNVLVNQILSDLDVTTCADWNKKALFAQLRCVSRTQRSLELEIRDLLGTAAHCDGFVSLLNQTCFEKPPETVIQVKPVVGGMCHWIDGAGFCDEYRRPKQIMEGLDEIARLYNDHLVTFDDHKTRPKLTGRGVHPKTGRSAFPPESVYNHAEHYNRMRETIQDHYDVAFYVMSETFPILKDMIIQKGLDRPLGMGQNDARLDPNVHLPDGRFRAVRVRQNNDWKDYNGETLYGIDQSGNPVDWHFMGDHGDCPTCYRATPVCSSYGGSGYPSANTFGCVSDRMTQTSIATDGCINEVIGPGNAQDKIDDMVANSSQPLSDKTVSRSSFSDPTRKYKEAMYDQDMNVPSNWSPSDANRDNTNPLWRVPFTKKNTLQGDTKPPGFTLYGAKQPENITPLDECPIPDDFPWEKVFRKKKTFLSPLQAWLEKIPEWTDTNIPDVPNLDIPQHIQDAVYLTYTRRRNTLPDDVKKVSQATGQVFAHIANLKQSWEKVKEDFVNRTQQWDSGQEEESLFSGTLKGVPEPLYWGINPNPQGNNTDLCINRLLSPYECCTDDATAYECCFGLIGCIPPIPQFNITLVSNVSFILDAQCSGGSNIILSIFAVPRFIFGSFIWTFIFVCPTWLRPILFKIFYPLIYDYGGRGIFAEFASDMFCLVVNLYYLILIVIVILGIMMVDMIWVSFIREMIMLLEMARMDLQIANLTKRTDVDRLNNQAQIRSLAGLFSSFVQSQKSE
jgi:hypothetical protein